ncbi:ABC-2 type transport system ATP-binding protein [Dysgonomonadaceae bacterium PH5-43]|nr:ABC-2 type transport system ATP-binding protein [Dysgonomonadaceae bacterium PH5-43]
MISIQVKDIFKSYGKVKALNGISFEITKGEIFGLIGPDGAGKTSLIKILTTLAKADKGYAYVEGLDVKTDWRSIRSNVGYMPGRFSLYQDLTIEENLKFFANLFNTSIEENYNLIEDIYVQIEPFKNRLAGNLSGGMKQKLALCCALIHKPKVLFLDEPTTGVDPVSRKELWNMLLKLKKDDISIIVSTPYMEEAELCNRIGLMKEGSFMIIDTPSNILQAYPERLLSVQSSDMFKLLRDLKSIVGVKTCFAFGNVHHITVEKTLSEEALYKYLVDVGNAELEMKIISPTIEDCYMYLSAK